MLSPRVGLKIFKDPNDCLTLPSYKNKPMTRGLKQSNKSFKDSTNTGKSFKSLSESINNDSKKKATESEDLKKHASLSDENLLKSQIKESEKCHEPDDYPEIESMHLYEEPEDDYEDIMPKSERISKIDIENLFEFTPICKLREVSAKVFPDAHFDESLDFDLSIPFPVYEDLYESSPCQPVELPSNFFNF